MTSSRVTMASMASRSTKPIPSGIIRSLAEQLRRDGSVWEGRGRRPVDESRPSLISVLVQRLGLSRSVIQRALHGRSRAAPRQGRAGASPLLSRSESRSDLRPPAPKGGAHTYYRAISAAMAAAHQLPAALKSESARPAPGSTPTSTRDPHTIPNPYHGKHLDDVRSPQVVPPPVPGARGLEAIGLQTKPTVPPQEPRSSTLPIIYSDAASGPRVRSLHTQGRQLLEDGIDVLLSSGNLDPELKRLLLEVLDVLHR
jgi:hypothetical protein